jgi:hypothetical protein
MNILSPRKGFCMASNTAECELAGRGAAGAKSILDYCCGQAAL